MSHTCTFVFFPFSLPVTPAYATHSSTLVHPACITSRSCTLHKTCKLVDTHNMYLYWSMTSTSLSFFKMTDLTFCLLFHLQWYWPVLLWLFLLFLLNELLCNQMQNIRSWSNTTGNKSFQCVTMALCFITVQILCSNPTMSWMTHIKI